MAFTSCGEEGQIRQRRCCFPLKKRYAESNITLEGVEQSFKDSDPFRPPEADQPQEKEGPQFGAPDNWLEPFDPSAESGASDVGEPPTLETPPKMSSYVDKLGRVYPVDTFGNILRKTCRPFGVTTEPWKSASRTQKKGIC